MARTFNGTTQYLSKASALVTATPLTMACWVNFVATATGPIMMTITDTATNADSWDITYDAGQSKFAAEAQTAGGTDDTTASSVAASFSTWYHVCGVYASATSRTIYINGANAVSSAVSVTPNSGVNQSMIGALQWSGPTFGAFLNGTIAFTGWWNVALSAADALSLSQGISPRKIQPSKLISYERLTGGNSPEPDFCKSTGWTLTAAPTVGVNPRIYFP